MTLQVVEQEIEQILDKWLSDLPDVACFAERMRVYAPTCEGKCSAAVKELQDKITSIFKGSTTYEIATGCFDMGKGNKSEILCEPIKVIEVGHNCSTKSQLADLMEAITTYAKKTHQASIAIQGSQFYVAETEDLLNKYQELTKTLPA